MRRGWAICILLALAACSGQKTDSGIDLDEQIVLRDGAKPVLERYLKALDARQVTLRMFELDDQAEGYPRYTLLLDVIGSGRLSGPRSDLRAAAARLDTLLLAAVEHPYRYPRREIYLREHAGGIPADTLLVFGLAEDGEGDWEEKSGEADYEELEYE
jgi:hypothetical protein